MSAAEVDGVTAHPALKRLEQVDMHRLLRDPDELADLLKKLDCAEATQAVKYLAAHLHSATETDAIGVIEQLAFIFDDEGRPGQSSRRDLSRSVAAFVADCLQFVDDDAEFIIEFVSTVPLECGYEFLCNVGAAHGLVRTRPDRERTGARRYVSDAEAVEHGIEIWQHRAKRAIASGYVVEEGDLFVVLDGLSRFGAGATDAETVAACSDETQPAWADLRIGLQAARPWRTD